MNYGLVSSLGGLVFLYLPATALHHRMVTLMACAFAMAACYTLGVISHFFPLLMMPVLIFIAILVTMVCRFYALGPPSSLFFIMAAAIGAYTPLQVLQVPHMVGLISMGTLLAFLIAFFYSIYTLRFRAPQLAPPLAPPSFDFVVFDSVVIGIFVGISLALAQVLQLQKSYWVPVSCLAVIQGASLRAVWTKQLNRMLGTGAGLLVAWGLLLLPLDKWTISLTVMVLTFVIEMTVVRHYAFAAIFITPLTILLVEAATLGANTAGAADPGEIFRHLARLSGWTGRRHLPAQPALSAPGGWPDAAADSIPLCAMRRPNGPASFNRHVPSSHRPHQTFFESPRHPAGRHQPAGRRLPAGLKLGYLSASTGQWDRFPSCTRSGSRTGAGFRSAVFCMP